MRWVGPVALTGRDQKRKKFGRKLHLMVLKQNYWQEQDIFSVL
jgi:hypothetical protein